MTNKDWLLLSLGSQQHVPGAFRGFAGMGRTQRRVETTVSAVSPALTAATATGMQAATRVQAQPGVAYEPHRR